MIDPDAQDMVGPGTGNIATVVGALQPQPPQPPQGPQDPFSTQEAMNESASFNNPINVSSIFGPAQPYQPPGAMPLPQMPPGAQDQQLAAAQGVNPLIPGSPAINNKDVRWTT